MATISSRKSSQKNFTSKSCNKKIKLDFREDSREDILAMWIEPKVYLSTEPCAIMPCGSPQNVSGVRTRGAWFVFRAFLLAHTSKSVLPARPKHVFQKLQLSNVESLCSLVSENSRRQISPPPRLRWPWNHPLFSHRWEEQEGVIYPTAAALYPRSACRSVDRANSRGGGRWLTYERFPPNLTTI